MGELDNTLAGLLMVMGNRLSRIEANVLENLPVPLTYRQQRILARVAEGHHTPQVLASFGSLAMPTMSESITVLVRRGLLERHTNPTDRRAILVHITPEGRKAHNAGVEALREAFLQLLPDLGDDEQKQHFHGQLLSVYDRTDSFFPPPLTGVRRGLGTTKGKANDAQA